MQTDIFTELAIAEAGHHANTAWSREAVATVKLLIHMDRDFTADDVWRILDEKGVTTHERRALGAVINDFNKSGRIRSITARKSIRRENHGRYITVWRPMSRLARV